MSVEATDLFDNFNYNMKAYNLSDKHWIPWFDELMVLAKQNGITTSDDADVWWDDFAAGKTPQESMAAYLDSLSNDQMEARRK